VLKAAAKEPTSPAPAGKPAGGADEKLLVEAAQKDPRRFADLYEANFERVYAFVSRRVRDRADVEDLTGEVFQQALANMRKFEWRGVPFTAWLYRIAANAIADRWQRASREQGSPAADEPPDAQAQIDAEAIERRAQLYRLVNTLPAEQRRVIELRFAEEKSIREIATEMKRTQGAIKQLQFRAIKNLRAQLDEKPGKRTRRANG
jgi:RNA polymerase sigma-70 factor, ECF subfamily